MQCRLAQNAARSWWIALSNIYIAASIGLAASTHPTKTNWQRFALSAAEQRFEAPRLLATPHAAQCASLIAPYATASGIPLVFASP